jgi:4a-hydroxytetrahydrobiopterin dehydratase
VTGQLKKQQQQARIILMNMNWQERSRPARLEKRYEFVNYEELRNFLDMAADLSESKGLYPDMGFGRDYVNITIHADEGKKALDDDKREFAEQMEKLMGIISTARE